MNAERRSVSSAARPRRPCQHAAEVIARAGKEGKDVIQESTARIHASTDASKEGTDGFLAITDASKEGKDRIRAITEPSKEGMDGLHAITEPLHAFTDARKEGMDDAKESFGGVRTQRVAGRNVYDLSEEALPAPAQVLSLTIPGSANARYSHRMKMDPTPARWAPIEEALASIRKYFASPPLGPTLSLHQANDRSWSQDVYLACRRETLYWKKAGVYLHFDEADALLYVGMATTTFDRFWDSRPDATRYTDIIPFESEHTFLIPAVELFLIRELHPPINKAGRITPHAE